MRSSTIPSAPPSLHGDGPLLVFAGAGQRQDARHHLSHRQPARGARRAAVPHPGRDLHQQGRRRDARSGWTALAGEDVARDLWVGTFHSMCARLLRRYDEDVGLERDFVIYDDSDQKARDDARAPRARARRASATRRSSCSRAHPRQEARGRAARAIRAEREFDDDVRERLRRATRARCARPNAVDFDDLILLHGAASLESPADARRRRRGAARPLPTRAGRRVPGHEPGPVPPGARALAARTRNLCVVGDDDQCIYRWRGADVRIIREFRARLSRRARSSSSSRTTARRGNIVQRRSA